MYISFVQGPLGAYRTLCTSLKNAEEKFQYTQKMNKKIDASNNKIDVDRDDDSKNIDDDDVFNDIDDTRDDNKHKNNNSREKFNKNTVLFNESRNLFNKDGYLVLEIGSGQENSVKKIFAKLSFLKFIKGVHDHKGITRCLIYQYHTHF